MNEVLDFPVITEKVDTLNQPVKKTDYSRRVFCGKKSIPQSEFFQAHQQGIKAAVCLIVYTADYHNDQTAKFNGTVYHIYRTYETHDDTTELYCEVRSGDQGSESDG